MGQKLESLQAEYFKLAAFASWLEKEQVELRSYIFQPHEEDAESSRNKEKSEDENQMLVQLNNSNGVSVLDWAMSTGCSVIEKDGIRSIFTNIRTVDALREALRRAIRLTHPLRLNPTIKAVAPRVTNHLSFSVFERLGRLESPKGVPEHDYFSANPDRLLETDVKTRLIRQHHQCAFPILIRPSRLERSYSQDQLQPLVLSSIFSHAVPHACIYHMNLAKIRNFRKVGEKFYNHSRMELGVDEEPSLSNIHQRTILIAYDLDIGRVQRAFLQLGLAIRMCFAMNLHRPEGYTNCKSAADREQAKRVFWAVWFFDTMVPHFFAQPPSIGLDVVKIDVPQVLSDFDQVEADQARFSIGLICIRRLAAEIGEAQRKGDESDILEIFEDHLFEFYGNLPPYNRYSHADRVSSSSTIWARRSFFCVLLDYCQCWITLYRPFLPSPTAITRTSQAAVAMVRIFEAWFRVSAQSGDGFDCFFRPYLYHFMSAIQIFKINATQSDRAPPLVLQSRSYLAKMLHMYRKTPTYYSFDRSQLEQDLLAFMDTHNISLDETYPENVNTLEDDPSADGGWGIFSLPEDQREDEEAPDQNLEYI
ncbi:hypothetical protein EC973_005913 [Apophysomyces ossiformis]|uniref:Xylanolytic transcriptional activator regulatory domain-containing protein n=1 Tax=Apophysomyces ossiformis TaxID=679940 RepID=A0A8H7BGZ3_9FUNG|nr:hypothetical protein EC973_005913 [Apophysomyces ossiformis]